MASPRRAAIGLIGAVLSSFWTGPAHAQTPQSTPGPPVLAVFPVEVVLIHPDPPGTPGAEAERLASSEWATELLRRVLTEGGAYTLAEAAAVNAAVQVAGDRDDGCRTPACVARIGRAVGAHRVLVTTLSKTSSFLWVIVGVVVDASTEEVVRVERLDFRGSAEATLSAGLAALARRIGEPEIARQSASGP